MVHHIWEKQLSSFFIAAALLLPAALSAQTTAPDGRNAGRFEIFSTKMPEGASWTNPDAQKRKYVRDGGYSEIHPNYVYVDGPDAAEMVFSSPLRIRENPAQGEYRYMTFTWVKWGGTQIGIQFVASPDGDNARGVDYHYTYVAGSYEEKNAFTIDGGLPVAERAPGNWVVNARDLWKDFGDCTITGIRFICPQRRDAGFDEIFLARALEDLGDGPKILPSVVAKGVAVEEARTSAPVSSMGSIPATQPDKVEIDWSAQIRAGGFMMYPLYLLALLAIVITVQRMMISRACRLVPPELCDEVRGALDSNDIPRALAACEKYPSTLANSLAYIFRYHAAGKDAVSEVAGDIAARDIKAHLARIYPISIISSLAPLLGLLGTVVGMIEAFGLVALYGDEGGAAILSDSISKALITTAAGLIIAVPSISAYFYLRNRITGLASLLESEIEMVLTRLYMDTDPAIARKEGK